MEDDKLQKLHDTLAMLRPKGRSGGLGMGSYGVTKKEDDGLPKNALYSRFVREGALSQQHKKFGGDEGEADVKAERKAKKSKTAQAQAEADEPSEKKRKRPAADDIASDNGASEATPDWGGTIKAVLKAAPACTLLLKALRKGVLKALKGDIGDMPKAAQKARFLAELEKLPKATRFDNGDYVRWEKKMKQ
jgi:hypothetical protein